MKILADENIPHLKELFSGFAEIVSLDGRKISNADLSDVDVLLVRSVTKVDKSLLHNTRVKFVGTATIGTDHLDLSYLKENNIAYVNAPGCNSVAVSEYVLSALGVIAMQFNLDLRSNKVGLIGGGNVGRAVARRLDIIGIPYGIYDPPLASINGPEGFIDEEELNTCDIISLHVPLTDNSTSQWPTIQMVDEKFFSQMKNLKYLINTSRGDVVDSKALLKWLKANKNHQTILDVWQNEPEIDTELLKHCLIGTPHIAGHSREGKSRGSLSLYHGLCQYMELEDVIDDESFLHRDIPKDIIHLEQGQSFFQALFNAVWKVYDIRDDDKALRAGLSKDMTQHFDRLRKGYKVRREIELYRIDPVTLPDGARRSLRELGFNTH